MEWEMVPMRTRQLDDIAEALPQRATSLAQLFLRHTTLDVSRTEIGVLRAVSEQPQRITDLAAVEGVTQPAITLLVTVTKLGRQVFGEIRAEYRALLHEEMEALDDEEVETLARAIDVLDQLVERLTERER
jgi:DNA-binding MarR family transcriptional regulator